MKFKEFGSRKGYNFDYKWVITDEVAGEFLTCSRCHAEAPVDSFGIPPYKPLCQICSSVTGKDVAICAALNVALTILGAFDEVEIVSIEEAGLSGYWASG